MKTLHVFSRFVSLTRRALIAGAIALILVRLPAFATTFTNDTTINANDTNYEGADIIVTNCTVTVDGPHAFSSLLVAGGGVLTHSFSPDGSISNLLSVMDESQVLNDTNPVTLLNSNIITASVLVTDSGSTTIYTNGADYLLTSPDGILTQLQRTTNSTIPDGTNVLVSYDVFLGMLPAGLNLSVTGNVEVAVGGVINANGKGYGGGAGAGAGYYIAGDPQDGSGAGYGGIGGMSSSNAVGGATYGSFLQPTNLGSGGGAGYAGIGGAGGGAVQISAGGTFLINGTISANGSNGTNSRSGGGSGGSIWITAHQVSGSGAISAQGGAGEPTHGGGGGGGRIAIQCDANAFAGSVAAFGGAGAKTGGAGTVYTKLTGHNGLLLFDNAGHVGTNSLVAIASSNIDVLIRGNAVVIPSGAWTIGNLTIASNGLLVSSALSPVNLTASNVTIQAGGGLLADSGGYAPGGSGYGVPYNDGTYFPCGGGGYGGNGANGASTNAGGGTTYYDSQTSPTMYGSGGGQLMPYSIGGAGGGAIRLNVTGTLQVAGTISANGGNGSGSGGGGGSGGSIWLTVGTLSGSGNITANGGSGAGSIGGGGGGGRIAIYPAANLFAGTISAYGGGGANWGGAGTIFLQPTGQNGQLILDNGGHVGTNTTLQSVSSADLIVRNGAIGSVSYTLTFVNLLVSSNAWLVAYSPNGPNTVGFSISGNATIQAGGGIVVDAAGYPAGQGPGAGQSYYYNYTYFCSGAGHGGYGANSAGNYALGGRNYDYTASPNYSGSGGGSYYSYSSGGSGGGWVGLNVNGTLQVAGVISANGGNGSGFGGGGGSGGTIVLTAGTLSGTGAITANGGNGAGSIGGGGGGGRIYVSCNNNSFAGNASAYGGGGANWGGAGTVLIQPAGQNGQLILDNGGHAGTNTWLQPDFNTGSTDLILRNGAIGSANNSLSFASLFMSSNAWLVAYYQNALSFTFSGNATIQAGGGIVADAAGYPAGQGSGAGNYNFYYTYQCSGAGHGGYGANGVGDYPLGGNAYDSSTSPTGLGSGGGGYNSYSVGGAGGGYIRLNVYGTLQVAGKISANGGNGSGLGGGGGSGGTIGLTVGTLSGSGVITANGGSGAGSIGGGGGGGRIAIYCYNTNSFAGAISAYGGGGANWGGAGTVYFNAYLQNYGQLILDNGGNAGANTTFNTSYIDLFVMGRASGQLASGVLIVRNLQISSNSVLMVASSSSLRTVNVTGNATIDAGGAISVDGAGITPASGPGGGYSFSGGIRGGGGHGGFGAANPSGYGGAYGSIQSPTAAGSGGGSGSGSSYAPLGGAGGGALRLAITGTLAVNGRVSANGKNGDVNSGGGSGGSLWITADTLTGSGNISANGGRGNGLGGGGAGGRISLGYNANSFAGPVYACGGGGYARGGAGTIYTKANSQSVGQLLVDNGGLSGTNTPLSSAYDIPALPFNLTIGGGTVICPQSPLVLSNLNITGGSFITSLPGLSGLELVVFGNANVAAGGGIVADAKGFAQASGPGAGQSVGGSGSGAGYGGLGGASATAPGGTNYGSAQCPVDQGSGGGFGSGMTYGGSEGGGAIRLNVGGVLTVDGRLSANGNWGIQDNSGGGSGGSIWVTTGTLAGNGQIVADGGEGELFGGGGGGGGRIALYSRVNVFAGLVSVFGGEGDFRGADGSIFNATNPVIQGAVTSTNGQPVSGILIQPDGGLFATTTDTNGNYVLEILPGWSGTVVPSGSGFVFAPGSRIYTNTTASISNQNYVATITIAPAVSAGLQATNLMMNWFGISGVTYQLYFSSNLVDWLPYGDAFPGTNGPVVLPVPTTGDPARFFRVRASN